MVKRPAEIYGVDFGTEHAKPLVVAALGGFSAGCAAAGLLCYASFAMRRRGYHCSKETA